MLVLTANVHAVVECSCNLRIHLDVEILLLGKIFIAVDNFLFDPDAEWLSDDRVGHVDEPLSRHLVHVAVFRQKSADLRRLSGLFENATDAERLVLWAVEHLDVVAIDAKSILGRLEDTYYLRLPDTMSLRK